MGNMKVTKRTYEKNKEKFIGRFGNAWNRFMQFAEKNYKSEKKRDQFIEEMCDIIDEFTRIDSDIWAWCLKRRVNVGMMMCDVCTADLDEHMCNRKA